MRLSLKQERFVNAYLGESRGNAAAAARMAGYKDGQQSGYDCLKNEAVRERINKRLSVEALTSGEVLARLSEIAKSPIDHFMQVVTPADDGTGKPMTVRLDYSAMVRALELLGKFHGLWTDKVEHSGPNGAPLASITRIEIIEPAGRPLSEDEGAAS